MAETGSYLDQLQEVARRQGKPFIDPTRIEGFGPGHPPAPSETKEVKIPSAQEMFGAPVEAGPVEGTAEVSPLVAAGLSGSAALSEPIPPAADPFAALADQIAAIELGVMNSEAVYKRRSVTLNDSEKSAVIAVILKALKRSVAEQYREIENLLPKRRRKGGRGEEAAGSQKLLENPPRGGTPVARTRAGGRRRGRPVPAVPGAEGT